MIETSLFSRLYNVCVVAVAVVAVAVVAVAVVAVAAALSVMLQGCLQSTLISVSHFFPLPKNDDLSLSLSPSFLGGRNNVPETVLL